MEHGRPVVLVAEGPAQAREAAAHAFRFGYDEVLGHLGGGMAAWAASGRPLARVAQWTVHELDARRADPALQVLDLRTPEEFGGGHVPGARNLYVPHLAERLDGLDRGRPVAAYCGSGCRASIAASVLAAAGFRQVANIPGPCKAWRSAGLPVEG